MNCYIVFNIHIIDGVNIVILRWLMYTVGKKTFIIVLVLRRTSIFGMVKENRDLKLLK